MDATNLSRAAAIASEVQRLQATKEHLVGLRPEHFIKALVGSDLLDQQAFQAFKDSTTGRIERRIAELYVEVAKL